MKIKEAEHATTKDIPDALLLSVDSHMNSWVLDLGASFHTSTYCNVMEICIARNFKKVYLVDGKPLDIVGSGDIYIKTSNGYVWKINKGKHVPKLMCNLISIDQLNSEGYTISSKNGSWTVEKGAMVVA